MRYRAVIFDLFGTLVDNFPLGEYEAMLGQMADVVGLPSADFRHLWHDTLLEREKGRYPSAADNVRHICEQLGAQLPAATVDAAVHVAFEYTRRRLIPRSEAPEVLARLKAQQHKIGLISDTNWFVPMLWHASPLARFIDAAVFSVEVGARKPDPEIYEHACHQLGVKPWECLYIGDGGSQELTGASKVGMDAVRIRVPYEESDQVYRPYTDTWVGRNIDALSEVFLLLADREWG